MKLIIVRTPHLTDLWSWCIRSEEVAIYTANTFPTRAQARADARRWMRKHGIVEDKP